MPAKKSSWKRGCFITGMLLAALLLFVVLVNVPYKKFAGNKVVIDPSTTRLTGPERPDGGIDYFGALNQKYSDGVTLENNAVAEVFRLVSNGPFDLGGDPDASRQRFGKALGFETAPPPIPYLTIWTQLYTKSMLANPADSWESERIRLEFVDAGERVKKPWKSDELPEWAEALKKNSEAIELLVNASKRTHYFHPLVAAEQTTRVEPLVYRAHFQVAHQIQAFCIDLQIAAMNSLGENRTDDAIEKVKAIRRFANLQCKSGLLVEKLIAIQQFDVALAAEEQLLSSGQLSSDQLLDYQGFLARHRCPLDTATRIDEAERYMMLDQIQALQLYGREAIDGMNQLGMSDFASAASDFMLKTADLAESMRVANDWYDRHVEALAMPDLKASQNSVETLKQDLYEMENKLADFRVSGWRLIGGPKARGKLFGEFQVLMWIPSVGQTRNSELRILLQDRLMETAFAMCRFHKQHGRLPESLDQLAPEFLDEHPVDPFSQTEYQYRKGNGLSFLIYNFGIDGQDNDGRNRDEIDRYRAHTFDVRVAVNWPVQPMEGSIKVRSRNSHDAEWGAVKREEERRKQQQKEKLEEDGDRQNVARPDSDDAQDQ